MYPNKTNTATRKPLALLLRHAVNLLPKVTEDHITDTTNTSNRATEGRYLVFELMEKAGYNQQEIADYFKMDRTNVCKALAKLDVWKAYPEIKAASVRLENLALN
jgi:transcriptional regulator with GAF, ATPase, and Fis domain